MGHLQMQLLYELLDAHDDTARLAADLPPDGRWDVHLDYLRDLQRLGREELARCSAHRRRLVRPKHSRRATGRCARIGLGESRT
jgi:hypothetical protein